MPRPTFKCIRRAGEETEVFPKTFEEVTMIGSRWVYKINVENSIEQQILAPTALEHPSPSRRGTAICGPEKSTLRNDPVSMRMPKIDDNSDPGRRVDDGKRSSGIDEIKNGATDHEKGAGD